MDDLQASEISENQKKKNRQQLFAYPPASFQCFPQKWSWVVFAGILFVAGPIHELTLVAVLR